MVTTGVVREATKLMATTEGDLTGGVLAHTTRNPPTSAHPGVMASHTTPSVPRASGYTEPSLKGRRWPHTDPSTLEPHIAQTGARRSGLTDRTGHHKSGARIVQIDLHLTRKNIHEALVQLAYLYLTNLDGNMDNYLTCW